MRPIDADESLAWSKNLDALRAGIAARKPDAIERIELQRRKLQDELGRAVSAIGVMQARERATGVPLDEGRAVALNARAELLQGRLSDLRAITARVRAAPLPDDGATPETAARPAVGRDLPESLMDAAMDLKCGWAVRVSGTREALMHYDELRVIGSPGETASRLERAYVAWRSAMAHARLPIWCTELVVCEGKSLLEASRLRGWDPRIIGHQVESGLLVYQVRAT